MFKCQMLFFLYFHWCTMIVSVLLKRHLLVSSWVTYRCRRLSWRKWRRAASCRVWRPAPPSPPSPGSGTSSGPAGCSGTKRSPRHCVRRRSRGLSPWQPPLPPMSCSSEWSYPIETAVLCLIFKKTHKFNQITIEKNIGEEIVNHTKYHFEIKCRTVYFWKNRTYFNNHTVE